MQTKLPSRRWNPSWSGNGHTLIIPFSHSIPFLGQSSWRTILKESQEMEDRRRRHWMKQVMDFSAEHCEICSKLWHVIKWIATIHAIFVIRPYTLSLYTQSNKSFTRAQFFPPFSPHAAINCFIMTILNRSITSSRAIITTTKDWTEGKLLHASTDELFNLSLNSREQFYSRVYAERVNYEKSLTTLHPPTDILVVSVQLFPT